MRLLLDECLPRKLKNSFSPHVCRTVPEEGWAGRKNGELLSLAEQAGFHAFLTLDRGIEYEQNLRSRTIGIVMIRAKSNRPADLLQLVPEIQRVLATIRPGQLAKVGETNKI